MTAIDFSVVGKAEQPCTYRLAELLKIASGKVGATHAAAKESVTGEDPALNGSVKAHAAPCMARSADNFKNASPYLNLLIILQIDIRQVNVANRLKTQPHRLSLGLNNIRMRVGMCRHRNAITTLDGVVANHVIDMTMGINDFQRLQPMTVDKSEKTVFFHGVGASRINNDTF